MRPVGGRGAFTLVEVVLAIGIISFALVALISLLSAGLQGSKESADDTNVALMTQAAITQLRLAGYTVVSGSGNFNNASYAGVSPNYFFDASGVIIRDGAGNPITGPTPSGAVYACTIAVKNPSPSPSQKMVYLQLNFSWPASAPIAGQQHRFAFASLAKYD